MGLGVMPIYHNYRPLLGDGFFDFNAIWVMNSDHIMARKSNRKFSTSRCHMLPKSELKSLISKSAQCFWVKKKRC